MAEALADSLILFYKRQEALLRAFQEWWDTIPKVEVGDKLEPAKASDATVLDKWFTKLDELEATKPAISGVVP